MAFRIPRFWLWMIPGAILLGLAFLFFVYFTADIQPPHDSDLELVRRQVADRDNGLLLVLYKPGEVFWPREDPEDTAADSMLNGDSWDEALAAKIFEKNAVALEKLELSLEKPDFAFSKRNVSEMRVSSPGMWLRLGASRVEIEIDDDYGSKIGAWGYLGFVIGIRCRGYLRSGQEQQALEEAFNLVRFAHRIKSAQGTLLSYWMADDLEGIGLRWMREIVEKSPPEGGVLLEFLVGLREHRPDLQASVDTLKADYGYLRVGVSLEESSSWSFHPNRTRARIAKIYRNTIRRVQNGDYLALANEEATGLRSSEFFRFRNIRGERTVSSVAAIVESGMGGTFLEERVQHGFTEILLALRVFTLDHGDLPETLDELVPDYLDKVPLDPYDRKPMRYSKKKRIIYCVGRDLVDSGGSRLPDKDKASTDDDEPTLRIGF